MSHMTMKDSMTSRQRYLGRLWRWYRAVNYTHRPFDWNGIAVAADEHELYQYEAALYVPPGYVRGAGTGAAALSQRRPNSPYRIPMAVVNRFTSLLFAGKQIPYVRHRFDSDVSEFIEQLIMDTNLYAHMREVRTYGGAVGTGVSTWHFEDSELVLEALDPRWVEPVWVGRVGGRLLKATIQYQFVKTVETDGVEREMPYWFKRVIDSETDTTYIEVPVTDEKPIFRPDKSRAFRHGFGFCPVVWVRNTISDDMDGDSDCYGVYDMIEVIDKLLSQSARGTIANCDPTLALFTDEEEIKNITTGSSHALKLPTDAKVQLLELLGSGPKTAVELAAEFRRIALETVRCVLDDPSIGDRATTTEVIRTTSAMHDRASEFRDQYGDHIRTLLVLVTQSIVAVHEQPILGIDGKTRQTENGQIQVAAVSSGMESKKFAALVRSLADESKMLTRAQIEIRWPRFTEPMSDDVTKGVASAVMARDAHLITHKDAIRFVAALFGVLDPERVEPDLDAAYLAQRARPEKQEDAQLTGPKTEPEDVPVVDT